MPRAEWNQHRSWVEVGLQEDGRESEAVQSRVDQKPEALLFQERR